MEPTLCPCGSVKKFEECCGVYLSGSQPAPTAEALMRSRYTAYAKSDADYLVQTTAVSHRRFHSKAEILDWAKNNHWVKLEILKSSYDVVEFKAYFLDKKFSPQVHHEVSEFISEEGKWYYTEGKFR